MKMPKSIYPSYHPPRLEKNQKLKRELGAGMAYVLHNDVNGVPVKHLTVPFDGSRYTELLKEALIKSPCVG